ncbi:MAG: HEAT repeat domain-containing protein [Nitrospirota bacterium]
MTSPSTRTEAVGLKINNGADHAKRRRMMSTGSRKIYVYLLFCFFGAVLMVTPGSISAEDRLDQIRKELNDGNLEVRLAAVEKLDNFRDERALNILLDVAGTWTERWPVKIRAIQFLGEARYPKAVELLLSIFNNSFLNWGCPSIKSYTANALGNFKGNQRVFDALIKGVSDPELLVREASIRSLGKLGDPKAVPHLVGLLGDPSSAIRLSVIGALEGIGDPKVIPDIRRVCEMESDSVVKNEALAALNNFREKRGIN